MAAYAALVSLMNIMEQIQTHPRLLISIDEKQIESLREKVDFLLDFIERDNSHGGMSKEATEVLENQIASAAHTAEDVIESHVVDQILSGSSSMLDLQEVTALMESIKEKVMRVKEETGLKDPPPTYSMLAISSRPHITGKTTMVGFDNYLIELMDTLTGQQSSRQIIPVVGMGGIGKTTLARNVYENLVIVQHFDIRAWVTVSQECNIRQIILEILSFQSMYTTEMDKRTEDQLGERLYKLLSGLRYLIILDDMWSIEVWDKIKCFFPNNYNGSRVVVTTRLSNVATQIGSLGLTLNFLDEDSSWHLFCERAFGQEGCPLELEGIGKKIVKRCKGLPLSIVLIGGLLARSYRTQEYWENIANDIHSIINSGEDEQCLNILSLSYNQLPAHLKACFLYMGTFPEDHEIRVSQLIKLWVAEGFLRLGDAKSLEEAAERYIQDLVQRNLILVRRLGSSGKIKTCNIHDLLRYLCLRVAEKEKFFHVMRTYDTQHCIEWGHRVLLHQSISSSSELQVSHALSSTSLVRSLISYGGKLPFKFKLLRVLNGVDNNTLEAVFEQVNLRYLVCSVPGTRLPSSISQLWNLQTLIFRGCYDILVPPEIWCMRQLRHLEIYKCSVPDPTSSDRADQQDDLGLHNVQTFSTIVDFKLSEEVYKRIPHVKKLRLIYKDFSRKSKARSQSYYLHNLGHLHELESLYCLFHKAPDRGDLLQNLTLPSSLKKLSLHNCKLHWEDLTLIGSLPNVEVLKLRMNSITGDKWNPTEGEFLNLKFLQIQGSNDLIYWNADNCHFPVLENLVLAGMSGLDEIPSGIGDIPTLCSIHLDDCSMSAAVSAVKILEEQESLGNESLRVRVIFWERAKLESFRRMLEQQSFTSNNFQLIGRGRF